MTACQHLPITADSINSAGNLGAAPIYAVPQGNGADGKSLSLYGFRGVFSGSGDPGDGENAADLRVGDGEKTDGAADQLALAFCQLVVVRCPGAAFSAIWEERSFVLCHVLSARDVIGMSLVLSLSSLRCWSINIQPAWRTDSGKPVWTVPQAHFLQATEAEHTLRQVLE